MEFHTAIAQLVPQNIVWQQNFGQGTSDPNVVGPPLPAGSTDFPYSNDVCPPTGSYTIVWATPYPSCFNGKWILLTHDHDHELNPSLDFGMMMLVNDTSTATDKVVYVERVTRNFCPDVIYKFSFSAINVDVVTQCKYGPDFPVFEYRIEDGSGALIKKDTTRPGVAFAPPGYGYKFKTYSFDFKVPSGVTTIVPKVRLLKSTYWCAEDFAVDGIMISTEGPSVSIAFNDQPLAVVESLCYQQNRSVSLAGSMTAFFPAPALQWQQSTDNGQTWSDIPGATSPVYSRSFSTPDTFLFRLSGADVTNIANPNCRVVSRALRVEINGIPTGINVSSNSPVCSGSDLKFNATGGATYSWSGPNGFYDNIAFPHIYFSSLKDSGTYYVQITTLGGCTTTDSTHVVMIGTDVRAGPDTAICKGSSVRLLASKGVSYLWSPSDGLSATNVMDPVAKPGGTTTYVVQVTDNDGCSDTAHVNLRVINSIAVKAVIAGSQFLCRPSDSASFQSAGTGKITSWNWAFGNGHADTTSQPPIQYYSIRDNEEIIPVRLAISDTAGCTDTTYRLLQVVSNCYIAVPSAFTPNGDGRNDYLYPLNAYKATNLLFRVYNRQGELIFETQDWTRKWDGSFKGVPQATGVYVWMLEYNDARGKKVSMKGTSVLIR